MQPSSQVSHIWQDTGVTVAYKSGVSLHSHTSLSLETLSFIHAMCLSVPAVGLVVDVCAKRTYKRRGLEAGFRLGTLVPAAGAKDGV